MFAGQMELVAEECALFLTADEREGRHGVFCGCGRPCDWYRLSLTGSALERRGEKDGEFPGRGQSGERAGLYHLYRAMCHGTSGTLKAQERRGMGYWLIFLGSNGLYEEARKGCVWHQS